MVATRKVSARVRNRKGKEEGEYIRVGIDVADPLNTFDSRKHSRHKHLQKVVRALRKLSLAIVGGGGESARVDTADNGASATLLQPSPNYSRNEFKEAFQLSTRPRERARHEISA